MKKELRVVEVNDQAGIVAGLGMISKCEMVILDIENKYQKQIDELIANKEKEMATAIEVCEKTEANVREFVEEHRNEIFSEKRKTYVTPFGKISSRTTPPTVEFAYDDEWIIKRMKRMIFRWLFDKNFRAAVRTKRTVVKTVVRELDEKTRAKLGITVTQTEILLIEPFLEAR